MFTLVNLSYLICVAYFYCVLVRLRLYCVRIFDWLGVAVRSQNNFPLYCFFVAWIIKESKSISFISCTGEHLNSKELGLKARH